MDSDISDVASSGEPFEVRDAGGGRGMGCFATREIIPGETILATYTKMSYYETKGAWPRLNLLIDLYERLSFDEKAEWGALYASYHDNAAGQYRALLDRPRPDGTVLTEAQKDNYVHLIMAYESNAFNTVAEVLEASVLYPDASRFNHSCDPNVTYECDTYPHRWVGRANRLIQEGEELTISYLSNYSTRAERQKSSMASWGFICDCPKCTAGLDVYTASLERARNIALGTDGGMVRQISYGDTDETMTTQMRTRVDLLRVIANGASSPEEKKYRSRELAMALMEASATHGRWRAYWMDVNLGGGDVLAAAAHAKSDYRYIKEAATVARVAWSDTHEMFKCVQKQAKTSMRTWHDFRALRADALKAAGGNPAGGNPAG